MKLIAETELEDQLISGLVDLLRDLKVDACGFRRGEAIAPVFWASEDFSLQLSSIKKISKDEITDLLESLEPKIQDAMILAGFEVIEKYVNATKCTQVHQHHRHYQQ